MRLSIGAVALSGLAAFGASACGGTEAAKAITVTTAAEQQPGATTAPQTERTKARPGRKAPVSAMKRCDANIRARRGTTSCAFAENVFYGYWLNRERPGVFADTPIRAYSPAVARTFDVDCSGTNTIVCRAGHGGYVRFPMAAVSAYGIDEAKRYASAAELGDVPAPDDGPDAASPPPSDDGGDKSNCDPSYEGACLDPNSYDYDCEGGSGDGLDYTGPVTVVGDDHFGLDRDGDGDACE
jgi:hypothetical protein